MNLLIEMPEETDEADVPEILAHVAKSLPELDEMDVLMDGSMPIETKFGRIHIKPNIEHP